MASNKESRALSRLDVTCATKEAGTSFAKGRFPGVQNAKGGQGRTIGRLCAGKICRRACTGSARVDAR